MYEDIKGFIKGVFSFVFWTIILSFCIGYSLGNYYGMKSSYEQPRVFQFKIAPGYFLMLINTPGMKNFEPQRTGK